MKKYEELIVEILLINEDVVRCSNTYSSGDDIGEDIFE